MLEIDGPVRDDGVTEIVLRGALDLATAPELVRRVRAAGRPASLLLDLRGLDFMDSSGIAALIRVERHARAAGGRLCCLVDPAGAVGRVLDMTLLGELLGVCEAPPLGAGPG